MIVVYNKINTLTLFNCYIYMHRNLICMNTTNLNRLKVVLVEQNKTGKWLAEQLGKSTCTVSKWCQNTVQLDLQTLDSISRLLDEQIDIQEQIKTDYDHIQSQITEIESELLNDTMDMESPRYKELIRMDDSLQTAIFTMYDYEDLKTFFENNVKDEMNKYQYQNLMLELEEYREK